MGRERRGFRAPFLLLGCSRVALSSTPTDVAVEPELSGAHNTNEFDSGARDPVYRSESRSQTKGGEALLSADRGIVHDDAGDMVAAAAAEIAPPWYAIWTRSNCEHLVAEQLAGKGFVTFLPEMGARSTRQGKSHVVQVPMFPGYLFLRDAMDKRSYIEILKARGIVKILEGGWNRLTPIAEDEVRAIQRLVESGVPVLRHDYFRHGDRVRVVAGPLTGVEGMFLRDKPHRGRLVVSVNLLQTSVAVEVDAAFVEAITSRRAH
jgi:transcriptional antiterminator NusG